EKRLQAMVDLCETALCRWQALLAYFGEEAPRCGRCDLCLGETARYDATIDAQKILSAVFRSGERFGAGQIADILTGEASEGVKRHGHDQLKTFGVGRDRPKRTWMMLTRQLF